MIPFKKWCQDKNIGMTYGYELLKKDKLHAIKLGRKTYITDEEDARFVQSLPAYESENGKI